MKTTITTVTLQGCPFGDHAAPILTAEVSTEGGDDPITSSDATIRCPTCGARMEGATIEEAVAKWNTRDESAPPDPQPPDPPDYDSTVRFNPGHCMTVDVGSGGGGLEGWKNQIREIKDLPEWRSAGVLLNWDDIETDTRGVYDFTIFDALRDVCHECGKGLHIGIKFQWFGNPTDPEGKLPKYLDTILDGKPGYSCRPEDEEWAGNLSLYVHLHDERVMTAYLDMMRALAEHIGADDTLYVIAFGETSVDAPESSGFTTEKWFNQIVRFGYETRQAFPHTEVRVGTNYIGSKQTMCDLMDELDAYDIMKGGPDNYSRSYDSNLAQNGQVDGKDRRGSCAWMSENQRPAGSSGGDDTTSAEITEHNNEGDEALGGSMWPHYWQWSRNYDDFDPWSKIKQHVRDIGGATNTDNPHEGKKIRRRAPRWRRVVVTNPTVVGRDDLWPIHRP